MQISLLIKLIAILYVKIKGSSVTNMMDWVA